MGFHPENLSGCKSLQACFQASLDELLQLAASSPTTPVLSSNNSFSWTRTSRRDHSCLEMGGLSAIGSHDGVLLIPNGAITGMEGGDSEYSYTRNSKAQSHALVLILKPVLQQEIRRLEFKEGVDDLQLINVADLVCSVGDNSLKYADLILKTILKKHGSSNIQYFFSDLPTNGFNTLFRQLEGWKMTRATDQGDGRGGRMYPAAVPGSLHKRLFPAETFHIVICTWALHYLSQVPDAVNDKTCAAYNKHRVHIHGAPPAVVEAYAELSKHYLGEFISCRAQEVASGGLVVLYFRARVDESPRESMGKASPTHDRIGPIFEETWKTLVMEVTESAIILCL